MTTLSGRTMCKYLVSLGIPAQKIVRKQETGEYVAEFFVPEMSEAIASAKEWASKIAEALPQTQIIDTHDTVATWRDNQPVIYATVIFKLEGDL